MIKHRQFASVNLPLPDRASLDVRFQSCRLRHEPKRMFALVSAVLLIWTAQGILDAAGL